MGNDTVLSVSLSPDSSNFFLGPWDPGAAPYRLLVLNLDTSAKGRFWRPPDDMIQAHTLGGEGGQGRKGSPGSLAQPKAGGKLVLLPAFSMCVCRALGIGIKYRPESAFYFYFFNLTEFFYSVGIKFRQNETCRVFLFLSFVGKLPSHSTAKDAHELLILLPKLPGCLPHLFCFFLESSGTCSTHCRNSVTVTVGSLLLSWSSWPAC